MKKTYTLLSILLILFSTLNVQAKNPDPQNATVQILGKEEALEESVPTETVEAYQIETTVSPEDIMPVFTVLKWTPDDPSCRTEEIIEATKPKVDECTGMVNTESTDITGKLIVEAKIEGSTKDAKSDTIELQIGCIACNECLQNGGSDCSANSACPSSSGGGTTNMLGLTAMSNIVNVFQLQPGFINVDMNAGKGAGSAYAKIVGPGPTNYTVRAWTYDLDEVGGIKRYYSAGSGLLAVVRTRTSSLTFTQINPYKLIVTYRSVFNANRVETVTVEDPDNGTNQSRRVRITAQRGDGSVRYRREYEYISGTTTIAPRWKEYLGLDEAGTPTQIKDEKTWMDTPNTFVRETQVSSPDGTVLSHVLKRYILIDQRPYLLEEIVDPNGRNLKTTYTYAPTFSEQARIQIKVSSRQSYDGSWVKYEYDLFGRKLKEIRPWLNSTIDQDESFHDVTKYTYQLFISSNGDVVNDNYEPLTESRSIAGNPVSRKSYNRFRLGDFKRTIVTESIPSNSSETRQTIQDTYLSEHGTNNLDFNTEKTLSRTSNYDGSQTIVTESKSASFVANSATSFISGMMTTKTTTESGYRNSSGVLAKGTKTVVVVVTDYDGERGALPYPVSESTTVYDIETGAVLNEESWYLNSNIFYDFEDRVTKKIYSDGTQEQNIYSCCNLVSTVDRQGIQTDYEYDELKRRIKTTRLGISTENVLDALGRTIKSRRTDKNGNTIVTSKSSYDSVGEVISSTDIFGKTTQYSYVYNSDGTTSRVTTYPTGVSQTSINYRDGQAKEETTPSGLKMTYEYGFELDTDLGYNVLYNKVTEGDPLLNRFQKTFTDFFGRSYMTETHKSIQSSTYNTADQMVKSNAADGEVSLYEYEDGELVLQALDMDRNSTIDLAGTDRVTETDSDYVQASTLPVSFNTHLNFPALKATNVAFQRTRVYSYRNEGSSQKTLVSTSYSLADTDVNIQGSYFYGISLYQDILGNYSYSFTKRLSSNSLESVQVNSDGTYTKSVSVDGYVQSSSTYDASGVLLAKQTYTYDELNRQKTMTDLTTVTTYNYSPENLQTSISVKGINDTEVFTTSYAYDEYGRQNKVTNPDQTETLSDLNALGQVVKRYGSRQYPVSYTYDLQGRVETMTTWKNNETAEGAAVTRWEYDSEGNRSKKIYPDSKEVLYSYSAGGKLNKRTWSRGLETNYLYDNAGQQQKVDYSDETADITYTYNRLGQVKEVTDALGTRRMTYDADSLPTNETYFNGELAGFMTSQSYDYLSRRQSFSWTSADNSTSRQFDYTYDQASRLNTIVNNSNVFTYSYNDKSTLLESTSFNNGSEDVFKSQNSFDPINRLKTIEHNNLKTSNIEQYSYELNKANQRTKFTLANGEYWDYQYDDLGQVISAKRYDSSGQLLKDLTYNFDDIGNRTASSEKDFENSVEINSISNSYQSNALNQYSSSTLTNSDGSGDGLTAEELLAQATAAGDKLIADARTEGTALITEARTQAQTLLDDARTQSTEILNTATQEGDQVLEDAQAQASDLPRN